MRKIVVFIICTLLLCACDPAPVRNGRKIYERYYRKVLNDPESFKVYSEHYNVVDGTEVQWTLDYGAKNGYGAMVRKTVTFTTLGEYYITIDGETYSRDDLR